MWDPGTYLRFGSERARPFFDLLTRVQSADPGYVVDLGCGPGNLTALLAARWPEAHVLGVDSSAEMIAAARAELAGPAGSGAGRGAGSGRAARPGSVRAARPGPVRAARPPTGRGSRSPGPTSGTGTRAAR